MCDNVQVVDQSDVSRIALHFSPSPVEHGGWAFVVSCKIGGALQLMPVLSFDMFVPKVLNNWRTFCRS